MENLIDLDDLLVESVKLVQNKKLYNSRLLKKTRDKVDGILARSYDIKWEVLEYIEVWTQIKCRCGRFGGFVFLRYMQKKQKKDGSTLHWETIEELPDNKEFRTTLVTRDIERCGDCARLIMEHRVFEDFTEVIKCQV